MKVCLMFMICQHDAEECDLFSGEWVPKPSGPVYTNMTCRFIESHQNCLRNGRPDTGYMYWRWKPRDCELPVFEPERFLEMMRSKSWALIGDSIQRNHVQSLLCMLSTVCLLITMSTLDLSNFCYDTYIVSVNKTSVIL